MPQVLVSWLGVHAGQAVLAEPVKQPRALELLHGERSELRVAGGSEAGLMGPPPPAGPAGASRSPRRQLRLRSGSAKGPEEGFLSETEGLGRGEVAEGPEKENHIFRPQIERAVHEFLAAQKKEAVPAPPPEPESQDPAAPSQDAS